MIQNLHKKGMGPKNVFESEIDFNTLSEVETLNTKLSIIQNKLQLFKNPYIGNKRKLIKKIIKTIDKYDIKYNSFLDLFAGSGFVSMAMKMLNKKVICNDILYSSYINTYAFVLNKDIVLSEEEKNLLYKKNDNYKKFISREYLDKFSEEELVFMENYYWNAKEYPQVEKFAYAKQYLALSHLLNYIMEKCFVGGRLNKGQILAEYNYRVKHKRNKSKTSKSKEMNFKDIRWIPPLYTDDPNCHECFNFDAIYLLEEVQLPFDIDLCYIDPPYGGEQSDYFKMYKFFEHYLTEGESENGWSKAGSEKFTHNKNYESNFRRLIKASSFVPWLIISYNDSSWGNIEKIRKILLEYRNTVTIDNFSYSYNYRYQSKNTKDTKEYLILACN